MRRSLAGLVAVSLFFLPVHDVSAACDAAGVVQSMANVPCSSSEEICRGWRAFRAAHPFPHQTIAVTADRSGNAVVILSEVPPIAPPTEVAALCEAVFAGYSPRVDRLRYPIGHDGWLEDIVLSVKATPGPTVSVPTADGGAINLPHGIANRLQYLYATLFGGADNFYVDRADASAAVATPKLEELQLTTADLSRLVTDQSRKWHPLDSPDVALSWNEVVKKTGARTFIDDSASVVVLAIPPKTNVSSIRYEFRRFAVSSDYIVGALRPRNGGLMLFARDRQIPLSLLPPLRFETVASLSNTLGQPLGQSYERQRALAGKIHSGDLAEWDWAPIYLSPQLQDSEFGTLLNLADQQLKSWSERGEVRYARFAYPDPKAFPFEETTATEWFLRTTLSTSLIFNWNTSGFSTAVDYGDTGRIISAASTTALPVSYIPPLTNEPEVFHELRTLLAIDSQARAVEASKIGSRYFASVGDPLLVRVVQNVFLYQILSETKPFKAPTATPLSETKRSTAVTKILIAETSRWLKEATAPGPERSEELAELVRTSGTTIPKLAELLAAPDLSTRAIVRAVSAAELNAETLKRVYKEYESKNAEAEEVDQMRRAAFLSRCHELGGTIEVVADRTICNYKLPKGEKATFPTTHDARAAALRVELDTIKQTLLEAEDGYRAATATMQRLAKEQEMAERVADDLRSRASLADDLDAVLSNVLKATSAIPSQSSIQTPSVVLSCNVENEAAVGGHNIDALPWLAKQGSSKGAPVVRSVSDRPTVLMPKERLGQSTQIARGVIERTDNVVPVDRPLSEALGIPKERKSGSFYEELQTRNNLEAPDAALLERAKACHCDVYVERGEGDVSLLVSLGPPPKSQTIFGSAHLAERLAETKPSSRLLMAGFANEQVSSLLNNAVRRAEVARGQSGFIGESIQRAKNLFRGGVDNARAAFKLPTQSRKSAVAALHPDLAPSRQVLVDLLAQRPPWNQAQVKSGADAPTSLVEVVFPKQSSSSALRSFEVHPLDAKGELIKGTELATTAKTSVAAFTSRSLESAITRLADQLHKDARVEEVRFFMKNVGAESVVRLHRTETGWVLNEVVGGE